MNNTTTALAFLLATLIGALSFAQDSGQKVRKWTDLTSGQSARAFLVGFEDSIVNLRTRDGRTYHINYNRLSESDKRFIYNQLGEEGIVAGLQPAMPRRDRYDLARNPDGLQITSGSPGWEAIDWKTMEQTLTDQATEPDKPVFWFRVLGDLDGLM